MHVITENNTLWENKSIKTSAVYLYNDLLNFYTNNKSESGGIAQQLIKGCFKICKVCQISM